MGRRDVYDQPERPSAILRKFVIIGDSSVGKTCILERFSKSAFCMNMASTIGVDYRVKEIEIDGQRLKMQIWDSAGQEKYQSVASAYYRGASGAIVTYDVTSRASFDHVRRWIQQLDEYQLDCKQIIVGNKQDVDESMRVVSTQEGATFARNMKVNFIETSAKTGENVQEMFRMLGSMVLEWDRKDAPPCSLSDNKKSPSKICCASM